MSDIDQQRIVEDFGKEEAPVRLLLASDVASEGINLHYLSHRMIHFDIPWSLMVFQQRNGRIDRYGQERIPQIVYLATQSENKKIRGDMRILELLIQKDEEAVKNIGDPAEFMGVYDIEEEENITAKAIEYGQSPEVGRARKGSKNQLQTKPLIPWPYCLEMKKFLQAKIQKLKHYPCLHYLRTTIHTLMQQSAICGIREEFRQPAIQMKSV